MPSIHSIKLAKSSLLSAAILSLLLVAVVVCSARAEASCGDYLHRGRSLPLQSAPNSREDHSAEVTTGFARVGFGPVGPMPRPCSGPGCGRTPSSVPMPIVAHVPGGRLDHSLLASYRIVCQVPRSAFRVIPSSDAHTERGFPLSIEVPPEVFH